MPYSSMLDMQDGFEGVEVTVNVMVFVALLPLTVNEPLDGDAVYPDTLPIVYEYVPFVRENEYDDPVIAPESGPLVILTYHVYPDGRPDSVNATV